MSWWKRQGLVGTSFVSSLLLTTISLQQFKLTMGSAVRILRMLTASHIVAETAQDTYAATPVSKLLTVPELRDLIKMTLVSCHHFARRTYS